jgi:DNA primase
MIDGKPDILPIVERETILKKVGRTHGGEYAGACPICGGRDRFRVWPEQGRFWCRGCNASGDVVDFVQRFYNLTFKDALIHLGMTPGRPAPIDPAIQKRRKLQEAFNQKIEIIYTRLCDRARQLHGIRLQVKKNPGALTEAGAVMYAEQMAELAAVDHKLDTLLSGSVTDQIEIINGESGHGISTEVKRRSVG